MPTAPCYTRAVYEHFRDTCRHYKALYKFTSFTFLSFYFFFSSDDHHSTEVVYVVYERGASSINLNYYYVCVVKADALLLL